METLLTSPPHSLLDLNFYNCLYSTVTIHSTQNVHTRSYTCQKYPEHLITLISLMNIPHLWLFISHQPIPSLSRVETSTTIAQESKNNQEEWSSGSRPQEGIILYRKPTLCSVLSHVVVHLLTYKDVHSSTQTRPYKCGNTDKHHEHEAETREAEIIGRAAQTNDLEHKRNER